eukprot:m.264718 g.264718  ORF g.264718 m.264718 type:complete len:50 (-) comp57797_c0_seq1:155-304(-)
MQLPNSPQSSSLVHIAIAFVALCIDISAIIAITVLKLTFNILCVSNRAT